MDRTNWPNNIPPPTRYTEHQLTNLLNGRDDPLFPTPDPAQSLQDFHDFQGPTGFHNVQGQGFQGFQGPLGYQGPADVRQGGRGHPTIQGPYDRFPPGAPPNLQNQVFADIPRVAQFSGDTPVHGLSSSALAVEDLGVTDLMRNRHYVEMYTREKQTWQHVMWQQSVIDGLIEELSQFKEIFGVERHSSNLTIDTGPSRGSSTTRGRAMPPPRIFPGSRPESRASSGSRLGAARRPPEIDRFFDNRASRSSSIAPSDSFSHGRSMPYSDLFSTTRPAQYPESILWTFEHAKSSGAVRFSKRNGSRPSSMAPAIRHANGMPVDKEQYATVKASARMVLQELATHEEIKNDRNMQWTKKYLKDKHLSLWNDALSKLEEMQPLLCLCANRWKTEFVFLASVRGKSKGKSKGKSQPASRSHDSASESARPDDKKNSIKGKSKATTMGTSTSSEEVFDLAVSSGTSSPVLDESPRHRAANTTSKKRRKDETSTPLREVAPKKSKATNSSPFKHLQPIQFAPPQPSASESNKRTLESTDTPLKPVALLPSATFLATGKTSKPGSLGRPAVDASLIVVDHSVNNLLHIFTNEHSEIKGACDLLHAFMAATNTPLNAGEPSPDVLAFLERIETADPNAPDLADEETNAGWGHRQFTAGKLTCTTILTSWAAVGNTEIACRLIAAALQTCQVARHLCFRRNMQAKTFISDVYLSIVIECLLNIWNAVAPQHFDHDNTEKDNAAAGTGTDQPNDEMHLRAAVKQLNMSQLKEWLASHNINVANKTKKDDLIAALFKSPPAVWPSIDDIAGIRKKPRK